MRSSMFESVVRKSIFCLSCKLSMMSMNDDSEAFGELFSLQSILKIKSPQRKVLSHLYLFKNSRSSL